jgi:O-antigen/teichoic acid export membrane protein
MDSSQDKHPQGGTMVRNFVHLGLGQVVTTVLTVLLSATIARTLGPEDFGLLFLITSIATFAYVFVDWGHGPYITRELARHPGRAGELMGSVLAVRVAMALALCGIAVAATWLLGYNLRTCLLAALMIVGWLPMYAGLSYAWAFRARERMDCDALINVVLKTATLSVSLVCLMLGGRVLALVLVWPVAGTITLIVATLIYRRLGLSPLRVTAKTARELVTMGASLLAISLAITVQAYIDANILYKLVPHIAVGWYGAAWNIAGTLVAPATILTATMYPRLSRAANDHDVFKHTFRNVFRPLLLVGVLGAIGTYLFGDLVVTIVYSKQKFGPAGDILRAFAPAVLLIYIDMYLGTAIMAAERVGRFARVKLLAVVVTTVAELALIPWCQAYFGNGGIGIMFALILGETVMIAASIAILRDSVDGLMFTDLGRGLVAGGATLLLMRLLQSAHPFVRVPSCVVIFLGLAAAVGLVGRSDWELLMSAFQRRVSGPDAAAPETSGVGR